MMPRYTYRLYQDYTCYETADVDIDATSEEDALSQLEEIMDSGNIDWECMGSDNYSSTTHELDYVEELDDVEPQIPSIRLSEL